MPPIGLLPAAGRGTRFGAAGYSKELFPLLFGDDDDEPTAPRPVCELALRAIQRAGAARCVVVVSPEKTDVLRVLGRRLETPNMDPLELAYVVQTVPDGLPHVVRTARAWIDQNDVVFALPDTVILPNDALARLHEHRCSVGADLALGAFPVEDARRLGPVEFDERGGIVAIHDKPAQTTLRNSWGVVSWSARFTEFLCRWDAQQPPGRERVIGHAFERARTDGMKVSGILFEEGTMIDIGTPRGLRAALKALAQY